MKLFVLGAVLVRMALPMTYSSPWLNLAIFVAGMLALAVVIGVVESIMARLRLIRVPQVLVGTTLLSAFAMVLLLRQ